MTGVIILVITILSIVTVSVIWPFLMPKWPKGKRITATFKDYKVTLIYGKGSERFFAQSPEKISKLCACASWSIGSCWMERRLANSPTAESFKWIIVHVLDDKEYEITYNDDKTKLDRTLSNMKYRKKLVPVAACRASMFRSTETDGNLVIYEMVHYIVEMHKLSPNAPTYDDLNHESKELWHGKSETSLEAVAHKRFLKYKNDIV